MLFTLALLVAAATPARAYWILTHDHALHYQRLDPIVNPGVVSPHMHTVIGSDAFAPVMDYADMRAHSTCTTAAVQDDRSSYWASSLYHQNANGTFTLIPLLSTNTYYLQRPGPSQAAIAAFPSGLRMIAGDPYRSTYNASSIADQAVSFVCLGTGDGGPQPALPTTQCPGGLRMQINFPSCWDGVHLDSDDHKAHMSYPEGAPDTGDCPPSHPVKTVLLFNEYIYDVGRFDFVPGQDAWVTATGDATGYSFHADFINGWRPETLAAAVAQCTGPIGGELENCPPFLASLNSTAAHACALAPVVEEDVVGPLPALPGCNPYRRGALVTGMSECPGMAVPAIKGAGPSSSAGNGTSTSTSSGGGARCMLSAVRAASGMKHRRAGLWSRLLH